MPTTLTDDMLSAEVIADPYAYYARLREEAPVHWNDRYGVWLISRHDDVVWAARHHEVFSSAVLRNDKRPPYPPIDEADRELYEVFRRYKSDQFVQYDPPQQLEMRKVMQSYFTPRAAETWRPYVKKAMHDLLDAAEQRGRMDVVRDIATPLPVLVVAGMMGVPEADWPLLRELVEKIMTVGRGNQNRMRAITAGVQGMLDYFAPLVDERAMKPGDDLISQLAVGEKKGIFTRHQVLSNVSFLLAAGHETTINMLCNGALAFMRHAEQWKALEKDPEALSSCAVEETLRYDGAVLSIPRIMSHDFELRGQTLRAGDRVRLLLASANRDPAAFSEPDSFDIGRSSNPHVAFGAGVHHCIGVALGRVEGEEFFQALATRFPSLRLEPDAPLAYHPSLVFRSLVSLPLVWR
jgi:cytochrome P450